MKRTYKHLPFKLPKGQAVKYRDSKGRFTRPRKGARQAVEFYRDQKLIRKIPPAKYTARRRDKFVLHAMTEKPKRRAVAPRKPGIEKLPPSRIEKIRRQTQKEFGRPKPGKFQRIKSTMDIEHKRMKRGQQKTVTVQIKTPDGRTVTRARQYQVGDLHKPPKMSLKDFNAMLINKMVREMVFQMGFRVSAKRFLKQHGYKGLAELPRADQVKVRIEENGSKEEVELEEELEPDEFEDLEEEFEGEDFEEDLEED